MITITFDYFENCIQLQMITITDYDYPRSDWSSLVYKGARLVMPSVFLFVVLDHDDILVSLKTEPTCIFLAYFDLDTALVFGFLVMSCDGQRCVIVAFPSRTHFFVIALNWHR